MSDIITADLLTGLFLGGMIGVLVGLIMGSSTWGKERRFL